MWSVLAYPKKCAIKKNNQIVRATEPLDPNFTCGPPLTVPELFSDGTRNIMREPHRIADMILVDSYICATCSCLPKKIAVK